MVTYLSACTVFFDTEWWSSGYFPTSMDGLPQKEEVVRACKELRFKLDSLLLTVDVARVTSESISVDSGCPDESVASHTVVVEISETHNEEDSTVCTCFDIASSSTDQVSHFHRCLHCIEVSYRKRGRADTEKISVEDVRNFIGEFPLLSDILEAKDFRSIASSLRTRQLQEPRSQS